MKLTNSTKPLDLDVIEADYWLSPAVKAAAIQAIDRRLGEMG